jgi:hypothetical protein
MAERTKIARYEMLSRDDFCTLVGINVNQFNVLRRRGQVPMGPPPELDEEDSDRFGYTPESAFLLTIAQEFSERFDMGRTLAAEIAVGAFRVFTSTPIRDKNTGEVFTFPSRWPDIARTSAQVANGEEPDEDILFIVSDIRGVAPAAFKRPAQTRKKPPSIVLSEALVKPRGMVTDIGTLAQIAVINPKASNLIAISLTQCAALLRQRATRAKIDLSEFWNPTPRDE